MKAISIIFALFTGFSCGQNNYQKEITNVVMENLNNLELYDQITIIPGSGCGGCISGAERFFLENVENKNILFIFTDIVSEKKLKLTVGDVNLEKSNVLIDQKNQFYIKNFEEKIYPFKLYVNKGKVTSVDIF